MKSKKLKLRLNKDLFGYKSGDVVNVSCDDNDIPNDRFWRNRLKDSCSDNCVEVVSKSNKIKNEKVQSSEDKDSSKKNKKKG